MNEIDFYYYGYLHSIRQYALLKKVEFLCQVRHKSVVVFCFYQYTRGEHYFTHLNGRKSKNANMAFCDNWMNIGTQLWTAQNSTNSIN